MTISHNRSGKVIVVFAVIFTILLTSLAAISIFLFQKEIARREEAEKRLASLSTDKTNIEKELAQLKKDKFLLEERNKEADDRINSLLDELELQEGLRNELKAEAGTLRTEMDKIKKERDVLKEKIGSVQITEQELSDLQQRLTQTTQQKEQAIKELEEIKTKNNQMAEQMSSLEKRLGEAAAQIELKKNEGQVLAPVSSENRIPAEEGIELPKIVVGSSQAAQGRVLTVDVDAEFVIVNLGEKDGLKQGTVLSVFRGQEYLGDVQVTRLQPEMSAADFIPPFSSRLVRKNDQAVVK